MTTLQSLTDTMQIRKIPTQVKADNAHYCEVQRDLQKYATQKLYPKLCRVASKSGEPLPVNNHASPDRLSLWLVEPLQGYELTIDEVTSIHLCYHQDDVSKNLYLIGKPSSNGSVIVEWYHYTTDNYLLRYSVLQYRNSPDIGLFVEQCNHAYSANTAPMCWLNTRVYNQLDIPWDFTIQSKLFEIKIPLGKSYRQEES